MDKKEFAFSIGIFDNITDKIKSRILDESNRCKTYGIGIYTDKFIVEKFMTHPSKKIDERVSNVKNIPGVDFTFLVDTSEINEMKEVVKDAYNSYLKSKS